MAQGRRIVRDHAADRDEDQGALSKESQRKRDDLLEARRQEQAAVVGTGENPEQEPKFAEGYPEDVPMSNVFIVTKSDGTLERFDRV